MLGAPHRGHFRPPVSKCCLTMESLTHCLQHGNDTASLRKVLLMGHFKYSGTSFMSMFSVEDDSLFIKQTIHGGEEWRGKKEREREKGGRG